MSCSAKIRPFPNDTELTCEVTHWDQTQMHSAVLRDYAWPGSETKVEWMEDDRRNFRGDWTPCDRLDGCLLPRGHKRECAL